MQFKRRFGNRSCRTRGGIGFRPRKRKRKEKKLTIWYVSMIVRMKTDAIFSSFSLSPPSVFLPSFFQGVPRVPALNAVLPFMTGLQASMQKGGVGSRETGR